MTPKKQKPQETKTAFHYTVLGDKIPVYPRNGKKFSLEEMQHLLNGYVQIINLGGGTFMAIDEEARLTGKPLNELATSILKSIDPKCVEIVGDVVVYKKGMF